MKKYFLFDNEPITGWNYLVRLIISSLLFLFIVGIWLAASTAYKRAGSCGWNNNLKVVCSIFIPVHLMLGAIPEEVFYSSNSGTLNMVVILLLILHFVLLFKNGNQKKQIEE